MAEFEGFTPLKMLNANRDDWKIRVKVYLLWNQSYRDNPSQVASMEMILIDQEASVMKFLIPDFRDTIKEGSYYEISNFGLGPNKGNYVLVEHEWKINFLRITKARMCPSFEIATDSFNLVSFNDVLERCIMWIGGFRASDIVKLIENHVDLIERQKKNIGDLRVSMVHHEECISQGMDKMQQSLAESLVRDANTVSMATTNLTTYMSQMAMAMGRLGAVETFLYQADKLREDTLKQLHDLLTTRQSTVVLLAINDYFSRLQALSTIWKARPRD